MSNLLDRIRSELNERRAALRPAAEEFDRLQRAAEALDRLPVNRTSAPASSAATTRPATGAQPAPRRRRAARAATARAAPGQTQLRVIDQLRSGPGSTSTAVAAALGISANAAAATISRLVKQGRVQRLEAGGYASVDAPPPSVLPVAAEAAAAAPPATPADT